MKRALGWTLIFAAATSTWAAPLVKLNEAEFRDKVFACWLGKNIGGTLGMPFEGKTEPRDLTFFTNLKAGEPAANDDLDLQLLWLKAMQDHDGVVDARILGEYWIKHIPPNWNEYGVGKDNMRRGILPPLSGEYNNTKWKNSNGAWIRSEIWACLFPGQPALAAKYAREDACVDHAQAEGTYAEIFTAVLESAAFVEHDRDKLIALGLSMIPADSRLARAIKTVLKAKADGKDWKTARELAIKETYDMGWFQAPLNVAFTMLGWLYGENDFGKSLCIAVGCGDDTDCTGATLGSIFGIIHGTKGIPKTWSDPIGLSIKTCAVTGFDNPPDLNALTDQTLAMNRLLQKKWNLPVVLTQDPSDLSQVEKLKLGNSKEIKKLLSLSPYRIIWNDRSAVCTLDYLGNPEVASGEQRELGLDLTNPTAQPITYSLAVTGLPAGWKTKDLPSSVALKSGKTQRLRFHVIVGPTDFTGPDYRMAVCVANGSEKISVPLTLIGKPSVGPTCLSLASKGAKAASDSELASETGCTAKVNDGILATEKDFKNRWHSSIDKPMPHWVEVKLAKPASINRVIVRFADPMDYPTRFDLEVKVNGAYQKIGGSSPKEGYRDTHCFKADFAPVTTDTVRLKIHGASDSQSRNAVQISELEVYGAE